jgi:hypothetical protein
MSNVSSSEAAKAVVRCEHSAVSADVASVSTDNIMATSNSTMR